MCRVRRVTRRWPAAVAALVVLAVVAAVALAIPPGEIKTVAGNGTSGFSGDNGPAIAAKIADPRSVAALPDGSFLIADTSNNRIRKVDRTGKITTVAGKAPGGAFSGDNGPATQAQLSHPRGVETLPDGGFLIADTSNNRVRRVDPSGKITTVAGNGNTTDGGDGGPANAAGVAFPRDISILPDGGGYLIADHNGCTVRKVDTAGKISTVAGVDCAVAADGDNGPATSAHLAPLTNVEALPGGGFLISDGTGDRIRQVDASGTITTVVGGAGGGYSGDNGPAKNAKINGPRGIAALPGGGYLFADSHNNAIRKVDAAGTITTVAGKQPGGSFAGDNGPAVDASLNGPEYVSLMPDGGFLIMDTDNERVRRVYGNAPVNTARPKITGTAFPGATLTCAPGTWRNAPSSYSFAWFRGTTKLAETSAAYRVVKGDRGRKLTCRVIAGNDVGAGVPAFSKPRGVAKLTLAGKPKAHKAVITFKVRCAAAACRGKATETRGRGKHAVGVGSRSFKVASGKTRKITVRLNKAGRAALAAAGKLRVRLRVAQTSSAGVKRITVASVRRTLKP
jgi:hypothetical protein